MGFRIKETIIRFMAGRNGIDKLYYALFILYIILIVLSRLIISPILNAVTWFIFLYMFFRAFSRNIPQRQKENALFERIWRKIKNFFRLTKDRLKNFRTKRYRKCPGCKTILRLPVKRGNHNTKCPRCGKNFNVRVVI